MKKNLLALLLFAHFSLFAQTTYWVSFTDKKNPATLIDLVSTQTLENRKLLGLPLNQISDYPLDFKYVDSISKMVDKVRVGSKWLNALSVEMSASAAEQIRKLSFVASVEKVNRFFRPAQTNDNPEFGTSIKQMNAEAFFNHNIFGVSVSIGVVDAGFFKAEKDPYLSHIFESGRVLGTRDYVSPSKKDFFGISSDNSTHGTTVLSIIAGTTKSYQKGMATKAKFYLARTDDDDTEYRIEEDYWIAAIEWMDSLGVRLVNTSLGYAMGHTLPEEDYQTWQIDGKTIKITKAAQIAAKEKGMILVNSAGNEGESPNWRIISAPSDAQDVISVGATNILGEKAGYSSIGPKHLPYLKPDVSCFSLNGTSFSAPAITGFVACMLEIEPSLTREKVAEVLKKSSHLYHFPNNYLGSGIPNAQKALNILRSQDYKLSPAIVKNAKGKSKFVVKFQNKSLQKAILFHKENEIIVLSMASTDSFGKGKLDLKKPKDVKQTTVVAGEEVIEIVW